MCNAIMMTLQCTGQQIIMVVKVQNLYYLGRNGCVKQSRFT